MPARSRPSKPRRSSCGRERRGQTDLESGSDREQRVCDQRSRPGGEQGDPQTRAHAREYGRDPPACLPSGKPMQGAQRAEGARRIETMRVRSRLAFVVFAALSLAGCDRRLEPWVDAEDEPPRSHKPVRIPGLAQPVPDPLPAAPAMASAASSIRGTLRLAAGAAIPDGAVLFVIARSQSGGPPLAVKRMSAGPFPLDFEIGPQDAMIAGRPFAGPILLSARIDADGDPLTRDLGISPPPRSLRSRPGPIRSIWCSPPQLRSSPRPGAERKMPGESLHRQRVCGLEMIIAIDSTRRGPALGGCRWKPYPHVDAARADAQALARAMTLKAALARLRLGGGKAVVIGDPRPARASRCSASPSWSKAWAVATWPRPTWARAPRRWPCSPSAPAT